MGNGAKLAGAMSVCVAVCLALASAAGAAYKYPDRPFNAFDAQQSYGAARCNPAHSLTSGGVDGNGSYADGIYLNTAVPNLDGAADRWFVYVDNYAGGRDTNRPRSVAVCDTNGEATYSYLETPPTQVADATQGAWGQPCPDGEVIVGGGLNTTASYDDEAYAAASRPYDDGDSNRIPDDGWITQLNNDEDPLAQSQDLYTTAICDRQRGPRAYRFVRANKEVPDGTQRTRAARCPRGEALAGGGVDSNSFYQHSAYINSSFAKPGRRRDKWVGAVDNYTTPDGDEVRMTVWAICRK